MHMKVSTGGDAHIDSEDSDSERDFDKDHDGSNDDGSSEREDNSSNSEDDDEQSDTPVLAVEASDDEEASSAKMPSESLAAVMTGILSRKPAKHKVILAKAKTDKQLLQAKRVKRESEHDGEDVIVKTEPVKTEYDEKKERAMKKKLWTNANRVKADACDREKERNLQRIATRGVVQLFNAVAKQQKILDEQLKEAGSSERRRDGVLKMMTKGKFLDVLKTTSVPPAAAALKAEVKKEEDDPTWSILRDDFMMGAKMKDWDKMSDSDEELMDTSVAS